MKIRNFKSIIDWFKKYQPDMYNEEGVKLYKELIDEEIDELDKAVQEKNLTEILDAVGDIYWVQLGYLHFADESVITALEAFKTNIEGLMGLVDIKEGLDYVDLLDSIMEEIIKSNYSKSYEQQSEGKKKGKIIKGHNFVKPNIKKIINKFDVKLKQTLLDK